MGKPTTGPEVTDVLRYMRDIEQEANVTVSVMLQLDGFGAGPRFRANAIAALNKPPTFPNPMGVGVGAYFPHREYRTFEGFLYRLLMDLDEELSKEDFRQHVLNGL